MDNEEDLSINAKDNRRSLLNVCVAIWPICANLLIVRDLKIFKGVKDDEKCNINFSCFTYVGGKF